jgi:hypothetical protein
MAKDRRLALTTVDGWCGHRSDLNPNLIIKARGIAHRRRHGSECGTRIHDSLTKYCQGLDLALVPFGARLSTLYWCSGGPARRAPSFDATRAPEAQASPPSKPQLALLASPRLALPCPTQLSESENSHVRHECVVL